MKQLAELAADPRLAAARICVIDAADETPVFELEADRCVAPGSVMKVLTSAAALQTLGPDFRAVTKLVQAEDSDEVAVVGGGDLTLSATPSGTPLPYPGAAHVDELARRFRAATPSPAHRPPQRLLLDSSLFTGETWLAGWDRVERKEGSMSYITALQVDGDREDPNEVYGARGEDPIGRAGRAIAQALGIAETAPGTAPPQAKVLASVESPTVRALVEAALRPSDNTSMEMLARHTAIAAGCGHDYRAVDPATRRALGAYTVPVTIDHIDDGSGLSSANAVPARYVARLMSRVWRREGPLGIVADALPVSGPQGTGTLASRFTGANAVVGDAVHAKTGWIGTAHTLAGYLQTRAGRTLAFAVFATGDVDESAKQAIDAFVAELFRDQ